MLDNHSKTAPVVRSKIVVTEQQKKQLSNAYDASLTVVSMLKFLQVGLDQESSTYPDSYKYKICPDGDGWFMIKAVIDKAINVMHFLDDLDFISDVISNKENDKNTKLFNKHLIKYEKAHKKEINELKEENRKLRALLTTSPTTINTEYNITSSIGAIFGGAS